MGGGCLRVPAFFVVGGLRSGSWRRPTWWFGLADDSEQAVERSRSGPVRTWPREAFPLAGSWGQPLAPGGGVC